ncbi:MAG: efflux RND transporter periplasmic adaptor subunit [Hydrogenovibrio sp.]|nr:efflux RND transporter periplasmic adaptor subunit [Hydrogenovibrio sp.]
MIKKLLVLVILIGGGITLYWWQSPKATSSDQIELFGNVDLKQVNLAFQVSGQIETMGAHEGSFVKAGQKLACVQKTRYSAEVAGAKAQVAGLQAQLDKLIAGNRPEEIEQAKSHYQAARIEAEQAQKSFKRLQSLLSRHLTSQDDVDLARTKADAARYEQTAAYNAWQVAKLGARDEDIRQLKAQLEQAKAQLTIAEKNLTDTDLIAPVDGTIRNRVLEPGDMASPQQTVMTLALKSPKWVRAYLSEDQLGKVKLGMSARISTDSYPGKTYSGWVGYISPVAEFTPKSVQTADLRTQLVYQVRVFLCDASDEMRLGMPATVHIQLQEKPTGELKCRD